MAMGLMDKARAETTMGPSMPRQMSLRERLEQKRNILQQGLDEVNAAIKMLDENPTLEQFHNVVERAGF